MHLSQRTRELPSGAFVQGVVCVCVCVWILGASLRSYGLNLILDNASDERIMLACCLTL
jgi:hypothetical protein